MNRALRTTVFTAVAALAAAGLVTATTTAAEAATTAAAAPRATTTAAAPSTAATLQTAPNTSLFPGGLFVQDQSQAAKESALLSGEGDVAGAASAGYIAKRSVAIWLGDWIQGSALTTFLHETLLAAEKQGTTPVFVTYAIPDRDCAGYSAGGLTDSTYLPWNATIASALKGHDAVVLVEPDSLAESVTCGGVAATRLPLIKAAVQQFAAAGVPAYLDGGDSTWWTPAQQASLLEQAGISSARGFFTNVSNFNGVDPERSYAGKVSALTGGSHFVIDVSRDGRGDVGGWCNPTGAGLGQDPHVTAGTGKLDALLWVKTPGASDGTCNGGPAAGDWFSSYASALVANRKQ